MPDTYIATKELTIDGKVIPKGTAVPEKIDPDRLRAGLASGSVVRRKAPEPIPAPVVIPPAVKPAEKSPDEKTGTPRRQERQVKKDEKD